MAVVQNRDKNEINHGISNLYSFIRIDASARYRRRTQSPCGPDCMLSRVTWSLRWWTHSLIVERLRSNGCMANWSVPLALTSLKKMCRGCAGTVQGTGLRLAFRLGFEPMPFGLSVHRPRKRRAGHQAKGGPATKGPRRLQHRAPRPKSEAGATLWWPLRGWPLFSSFWVGC